MTYLFSNTASIFQSNGSAITMLNPLPVTLGSANITVIGNTNIIDTVTVSSTPDNPVHTHVSEIGTSGILSVPWMPVAGNVSIDGNANVVVRGNISGITTLPGITGNVRVYGNVNVDNFPSNISITQLPGVTGNVGVYGNVSVTQLPAISGNVNVTQLPGVTGNVHIYGNIGGSDQPITVNQGTTPWVTTATINGTSTVAIDGTNIDAFGRLRVSEPYTIFDSALRYVAKGHFSNAISNGGTVTYDFNADVRNLTVTSSSGSQVIRESRRVFNYQPGKSLFVLCTFVMSPAKTNLQQRVGYFGANNGVFFEQVSSTKNMVIRSFSSGSIAEERIAQSSWNTDRLDGTGPSGITLDTTAPQIFFTDIEWLGVGTVRTGFVINGQFVVAHKFHHANNNTYTTTYMQTATLPIRYEITNLGATSGSSTMKQICCTVMSEGGYSEIGQTETAGTGVSTKRVTNAGTYIPLVSIRLNSNYLDAVVVPAQVDILSPSVNYYRWSLLLNPTLTGATWAGSSQSGIVDYDLAATAVTGGTEIAAGFADSRTAITLESQNVFQYQLGRTLANVSDVITLQITSVSNNADVLGEIGWQILS